MVNDDGWWLSHLPYMWWLHGLIWCKIPLMIILSYLAGWWLSHLPLWKIMELKSVGMMTFPTEWKIIKFHGSSHHRYQSWFDTQKWYPPNSAQPFGVNPMSHGKFTHPRRLFWRAAMHWIILSRLRHVRARNLPPKTSLEMAENIHKPTQKWCNKHTSGEKIVRNWQISQKYGQQTCQ